MAAAKALVFPNCSSLVKGPLQDGWKLLYRMVLFGRILICLKWNLVMLAIDRAMSGLACSWKPSMCLKMMSSLLRGWGSSSSCGRWKVWRKVAEFVNRCLLGRLQRLRFLSIRVAPPLPMLGSSLRIRTR